MRVLTEKQLKEIADIIDRHIGVMIHITSGDGKPDKELLKKLGIPENAPDMIKNAFVLGKIIKMMSDKELSKLSFEQLKDRARKMSLSPVEQSSLDYARNNAARYVTGLGNKIKDQITGQINNANVQSTLEVVQREIIKDKVEQSILKQQIRSKLASELGHALDDWKRDWMRVANTETWNAKLHGEVMTILRGEAIYSNTKGGDTLVFRRPAPDACSHCKRLYLKRDGVTPKVFKLRDLISNGTNVGKKVNEWQPIVGTTHPHCRCPIAVLPEGFGFDDKGNLVFKG